MIFDATSPESWNDLSQHPFFQGKPFEKNWYDGNVDEDLLLLRRGCAAITQTTREFKPELVVLDDCTFFVQFTYDGDACCELYPGVTSNDESCLFFAFPEFPELEIRVLSEMEAAEVMLAFSRKEDLAQFDKIE